MGKAYYHDYVNHMLTQRIRGTSCRPVETENDRCVTKVVGGLPVDEIAVIESIFLMDGGIPDRVRDLAGTIGKTEVEIWNILHKVSHRIAVERRLIDGQ
jgi:hypothetical protein